jgi:hypothetical protein
MALTPPKKQPTPRVSRRETILYPLVSAANDAGKLEDEQFVKLEEAGISLTPETRRKIEHSRGFLGCSGSRSAQSQAWGIPSPSTVNQIET